jgi:hypothetical protein
MFRTASGFSPVFSAKLRIDRGADAGQIAELIDLIDVEARPLGDARGLLHERRGPAGGVEIERQAQGALPAPLVELVARLIQLEHLLNHVLQDFLDAFKAQELKHQILDPAGEFAGDLRPLLQDGVMFAPMARGVARPIAGFLLRVDHAQKSIHRLGGLGIDNEFDLAGHGNLLQKFLLHQGQVPEGGDIIGELSLAPESVDEPAASDAFF